MKVLLIILLSVFSLSSFGQKTIKLNITHKLGTAPFALNQTSTNNLGNSFKLDRMQYYMSMFEIVHDGGQVTAATGVYALVDAALTTSINLGTYTTITTIEKIKFGVGVDSHENTNDPSLWPAEHPLSPKSPSMHWGWASGYFFVALGGNSSPTLDQTLELHGLGGTNYYNQEILINATESANELVMTLYADYNLALKNIDVSAGLVEHGTTGDAAKIIRNFRDEVFYSDLTVGLNENNEVHNQSVIFPNPSLNGVFNLNAKQYIPATTSIELTDISGRLLLTKKVSDLENNQFVVSEQGIYFVKIISNGKVTEVKKIVY